MTAAERSSAGRELAGRSPAGWDRAGRSPAGWELAGRELAGRELAAQLRARVAERVADRVAAGHRPALAVVSATEDEASAWYVRSIAKAAAAVGIECRPVDLGPAAGPDQITAALTRLSADDRVSGVILQTPLPAGARLAELAGAIEVGKDVDGANPRSLGRLVAGLPAFPPATAAAVLAILDHHQIPLAGRRAVVVGRSTVVGKPVAQLLLERDATVTVCHSRTVDLPSVTGTADVLVVAAGRAHLVGPGHVAPGAVVVDVGANPTPDGGLAGDVDPAVGQRAGALTPVPGGVGPITTALLLQHTTDAAEGTGDGRPA